MTFALLLAGFLLAQGSPQSAEKLHEEAVRLLESGKAEEAEGKSKEALAASQRFIPEEEIGARPERGLLFEDMIVEARRSYRERRARYFRTLGDSLAAQEKWPAARKAYHRAQGITVIPGLNLKMAEHPDLDLESRLDLLLSSYLEPASDRAALEKELLSTGAFLDRNALKAGLDRKRFAKLKETYPDLELLDFAFPDFQATGDGGTIIPSEFFRAGINLVVYFPVDGCGRCSEELDGLTVPVSEARKRKLAIEVAAFVIEKRSSGREAHRAPSFDAGPRLSKGLPPAVGGAPRRR